MAQSIRRALETLAAIHARGARRAETATRTSAVQTPIAGTAVGIDITQTGWGHAAHDAGSPYASPPRAAFVVGGAARAGGPAGSGTRPLRAPEIETTLIRVGAPKTLRPARCRHLTGVVDARKTRAARARRAGLVLGDATGIGDALAVRAEVAPAALGRVSADVAVRAAFLLALIVHAAPAEAAVRAGGANPVQDRVAAARGAGAPIGATLAVARAGGPHRATIRGRSHPIRARAPRRQRQPTHCYPAQAIHLPSQSGTHHIRGWRSPRRAPSTPALSRT